VKFDGWEMQSIYDVKFSSNEVVDEILKDSKGILLWQYQLKHLIRMFIGDIEKAEKLQKLILRSAMHTEPRIEKIIKKFMFTNNLSLYDVLNERSSPILRLSNPNLQGAWNLYKSIKE